MKYKAIKKNDRAAGSVTVSADNGLKRVRVHKRLVIKQSAHGKIKVKTAVKSSGFPHTASGVVRVVPVFSTKKHERIFAESSRKNVGNKKLLTAD